MIMLVVHPNARTVSDIGENLFKHMKGDIARNGLKEIFLTFQNKEIEIFYQEDVYEDEDEFRINNTLPFSFKGMTLIKVNSSQFHVEQEKRSFIEDLIKNIHYY